MGRLQGKTALITGAARGLGRGHRAPLHGRGRQGHRQRSEPGSGPRHGRAKLGGFGLAADVADSASVAAMFAEVAKLVPRLDILVNNAGISGLEGRNDAHELVAQRVKLAQELAGGGPVETFIDGTAKTTDAHWRRMLGVHVDGTFFCCREALKIMNPQMAGAIVNISSVMGTYGKPGNVPYSTAKAAILGFTRALAHEVAPRNIRVNAIAPGWIDTDMTAPLGVLRNRHRRANPVAEARRARRHRLGRRLPGERGGEVHDRPGHLAQRRLVHEPVASAGSAKVLLRQATDGPGANTG